MIFFEKIFKEYVMTMRNLFDYKTGASVSKPIISKTSTLRAIDLFAGIGGFRREFKNIK